MDFFDTVAQAGQAFICILSINHKAPPALDLEAFRQEPVAHGDQFFDLLGMKGALLHRCVGRACMTI